MTKNIKVLLVPTWEEAKDLKVEATVEAEYGSFVLKGSIATLAHHVEPYKGCPAPCNNRNVPVLESGTIVVRNIDLDTVGGVMSLMGVKPKNEDFWSVAEYLDLNGPHNINKISTEARLLIEAYWAWSATVSSPKPDGIIDVTDLIRQHAKAINRILNGDKSLIHSGQIWAPRVTEKRESCLLYEDEHIRAFITNGVFCNSAYYSPTLEQNVPVTAVYKTGEGKITISTSDGSINCANIVQELWGKQAGGHEGIAGSPSGKYMTPRDFGEALKFLKSTFVNRKAA